MRVKANVLCFVGGARRRPGDVFEVPDSFKSKHCDPVESKAAKVEKPKVEKKSPAVLETLSEMGKGMPKGADLI